MKSPKELVQIARSLAYTRVCTHLINLRYTEIRDLKKEMKNLEKQYKEFKKTKTRTEKTDLLHIYIKCVDAIDKLKDEINLINQDKFPFKEDEDKFLQISENILTEMIKQQALIESI